MTRLTTDEIAREQAIWTRSGWCARRGLSLLDVAATLLVLAALFLAGCCTLPSPRPCRIDPPPALHLPALLRPGERGCPPLPADRGPETIAVCLDAASTADLSATLGALDAWSREAWTACGGVR